MIGLGQATWFGTEVERKFPELGNLWQYFEKLSDKEYKRYVALFYQFPDQLKQELSKII